MRVSVGLPTSRVDAPSEFATAGALAEMAVAAEAAGFDGAWVTDHPFPSVKWIAEGRGGHHTLDPFVTLSVVAAHTTRLRLQTHIFVLPYRNPYLVAKQAATLDVVSNGRLTLGVGAGHLKAEFAALGVEHAARQHLVEAGITSMKAAWQQDDVDGNFMLPKPLQAPHPPVWVGGNSRVAIRHAVELADGWAPMPNPARFALGLRSPALETAADLRRLVTYARERAREVGRTDPFDVAVMPFTGPLAGGAASPAQSADHIAELAAAGATYIVANVAGRNRDEYIENLARAGETVLPLISDVEPSPA